MKLLLDTDAFCKLGLADLLGATSGLLVGGLHECGRLPALPYMLRKGGLRKMYGTEACDAMILIADTMPVMPQASDTWLDRLAPIADIDPGEAQIFAAAAEHRMTVVTGDKRALHALKDVDEFPSALDGRIVALEAVLLALCDRLGPDEVRRRVQSLAAADQVVKICFSNPGSDPRDGLRSYFKSLVNELAPLSLWNPCLGGCE